MASIKLRIPEFKGESNPEVYLEWEDKVEKIFDIHDYTERKKVKLAVVEFSGYASTWWRKLCRSRSDNGTRKIATWAALKKLMRAKYVPVHHKRELFQKLQTLSQGSKTVDEYYKEIELAMMRANVDEDEEATMARFMGGLNKEIANMVELHHYTTIEDMVQMAEKIEKQLKRRPQNTRQPSGSSTNWRTNADNRPPWQRNRQNSGPPTFGKPNPNQGPTSGKKFTPSTSSKGNVSNSSNSVSTNSSSIQCFRCLGRGHIASQCPNQRTMTLLDDGTYISDDEEENVTNELAALSLEEEQDEEEESIPHGDCFVTLRALNAQPREDDHDIQRTNIFHSTCLIKNKVCMLIIDGGSCTNLAASYLVDKMKLKCSNHPRPYKLHWMNDCGEIRVTK